jgi:hypothetical protein
MPSSAGNANLRIKLTSRRPQGRRDRFCGILSAAASAIRIEISVGIAPHRTKSQVAANVRFPSTGGVAYNLSVR